MNNSSTGDWKERFDEKLCFDDELGRPSLSAFAPEPVDDYSQSEWTKLAAQLKAFIETELAQQRKEIVELLKGKMCDQEFCEGCEALSDAINSIEKES